MVLVLPREGQNRNLLMQPRTLESVMTPADELVLVHLLPPDGHSYTSEKELNWWVDVVRFGLRQACIPLSFTQRVSWEQSNRHPPAVCSHEPTAKLWSRCCTTASVTPSAATHPAPKARAFGRGTGSSWVGAPCRKKMLLQLNFTAETPSAQIPLSQILPLFFHAASVAVAVSGHVVVVTNYTETSTWPSVVPHIDPKMRLLQVPFPVWESSRQVAKASSLCIGSIHVAIVCFCLSYTAQYCLSLCSYTSHSYHIAGMELRLRCGFSVSMDKDDVCPGEKGGICPIPLLHQWASDSIISTQKQETHASMSSSTPVSFPPCSQQL